MLGELKNEWKEVVLLTLVDLLLLLMQKEGAPRYSYALLCNLRL